jgi:hypothetical protein
VSTLFEMEGNSLISTTHPRNHVEHDHLIVTLAGSFDSFVKYRICMCRDGKIYIFERLFVARFRRLKNPQSPRDELEELRFEVGFVIAIVAPVDRFISWNRLSYRFPLSSRTRTAAHSTMIRPFVSISS